MRMHGDEQMVAAIEDAGGVAAKRISKAVNSCLSGLVLLLQTLPTSGYEIDKKQDDEGSYVFIVVTMVFMIGLALGLKWLVATVMSRLRRLMKCFEKKEMKNAQVQCRIPELDENEVTKWCIEAIRAELRSQGMIASGTKEVLVSKLITLRQRQLLQ